MPALSSNDTAHLESKMGYSFKDKGLLREAITHKSYFHENMDKCISYNERLEFLGDSVLELVIGDYLFGSFPEYTEAELSKLRAYIVQEHTLSDVALRIGLGDFLLLGKGEESTGGREKSSVLADALEALIGAIYLDGGLKKARSFIHRFFKDIIPTMGMKGLRFDFKTELQEKAQAIFGVLPRYTITSETGPEHEKTFEVVVFIKDMVYGSGRGKSKKEAAQHAAEVALKKMQAT